MSADALYDNLRSYLRLTHRLISKHGHFINVDEKFTLRFSGTNSAYAANQVRQPAIVFLNTRIYVEGTYFAAPTGGDDWHDLPDQELFPGESSHVDIEFIAKNNIGGNIDANIAENVAKAWITANLDQVRFFELWNSSNIFEDIEPT